MSKFSNPKEKSALNIMKKKILFNWKNPIKTHR